MQDASNRSLNACGMCVGWSRERYLGDHQVVYLLVQALLKTGPFKHMCMSFTPRVSMHVSSRTENALLFLHAYMKASVSLCE